MKPTHAILLTLCLTLVCGIAAAQETAEAPATDTAAAATSGCTDCTMTFDFAYKSLFYKTGEGTGTITCENGQSVKVKLSMKAGGLTAGKGKIRGGTGRFSEVSGIEELFGTYVSAEAHAGAGQSAKAQILTKGEVSLTLVGTGTGVDVGVAFGNLKIEAVGEVTGPEAAEEE